MPITQNRMMALIDAALDYQNALDGLISAIQSDATAVRQGAMDPAYFVQHIELLANPKLLLSSHESAVTIGIENAHFKSAARRNAAAAIRQQRFRALHEGTLPARPPRPVPPNYLAQHGPTAPSTMQATNHQHGKSARDATASLLGPIEPQGPSDPSNSNPPRLPYTQAQLNQAKAEAEREAADEDEAFAQFSSPDGANPTITPLAFPNPPTSRDQGPKAPLTDRSQIRTSLDPATRAEIDRIIDSLDSED